MENKWWHKSIVYQIYPRSFCDSNNDGIGDIRGIISKLDYLSLLGIDVIWLSPVYKSPMDDNGYDISDYRDIANDFGSLDDMDELILRAKEKNIKIIMDLVVNHTSDEHKWFIESKKSKENPYRDYYIWRNSDGSEVPNDIKSIFSGTAWEYDESSKEYYFHLFSKKQPDLNWENPKVKNEIFDMMNFWIERGISGFRMDVIDLIGKEIDKKIIGNGPNLHKLINEMNKETYGKKDLLTVGETWGASPEIAKLYSDPKREEVSMIFQFEHITAFHDKEFGKWKAKSVDFNVLKSILSKWQTCFEDDGWNSLFLNNHDLPRMVSKYGNDKIYRVESAKMLATMIHFMKGTPYIYQGEEIGMTNVSFDKLTDYKDIETLNAYKENVPTNISHDDMMLAIKRDGRDNARTPFHWDDSKNAGFSAHSPWIKLNDNFKTINANESINNPDSIFNFYKKLIELRKNHQVIVYGNFKEHYIHNDLYVYERTYKDDSLLVILNHTANEISLDLSKINTYEKSKLLISNYHNSPSSLADANNFILKSYQSIVYIKL